MSTSRQAHDLYGEYPLLDQPEMQTRRLITSRLAAGALACAGAFSTLSAQAAEPSYFAVVPVSGSGAVGQLRPVKMALAGAVPPSPYVGVPYNFNLGALLSLTGPDGTDPENVHWSISAGELPLGLSLEGSRVIGTPIKLGIDSVVTIRAEYAVDTTTIAEVSAQYRLTTTLMDGLQVGPLSASPASITADGLATTTITATVTNSEGSPVGAGIPVSWNTDLGALIEQDATTDSTGKATATLRSGTMAGTATIHAIVNGVDSMVYVAITPNESYSEVLGGETYWYAVKAKSGALAFYDVAINGKIYTTWDGPAGRAPRLDPFFPAIAPAQYTWGAFIKQVHSYDINYEIFAYAVRKTTP